MPSSALNAACAQLRRGRVIIYPTETFFAIGGLALDPLADARVFELKKRPPGHPFPVIIGSMEQLDCLAQPAGLHLELARQFWPGALSILFPAHKDKNIPAEIMDESGFVAIRLTAHPLARELCLTVGGPLSASSANISGKPPVTRAQDLDRELRGSVAAVVDGPPVPGGGLPSTLVRLGQARQLEVLRQGAISVDELKSGGWSVCF